MHQTSLLSVVVLFPLFKLPVVVFIRT